MDLPDYPAATAAVTELLAGHDGQHRCRDGRYYTPRTFTDCPVQYAVGTLTGVLDEARCLPHVACHDRAQVEAVAAAMCQHPDGGLVSLDSLDDLQRSWWISRAQLAMEAHAALLDPALVEP